ncbi:ABC transporter ATP-binding protein [Marispirochaeta sp.]|jgi:ABC-type nitrate/sulfonate/bicarbonate transport system ATPase subunit|uniref:ABC transporter ATP-binding protein n=1 Tax=Marispirochaeta sp. TaxID=2038653 RepID=UPI0029C8F14B|nr:ABC transporter ATP-binding protein [Marispirochaeta sp.]
MNSSPVKSRAALRTESIIRLSEVVKGFAGLDVIDGISLFLNTGEVLALLGPSGCGKSTLMHLVAGLDHPDSGEIMIGGERVNGETGRVGYMHQKDLLLPWKRVMENVTIPLRLKGLPKTEAEKTASPLFAPFGLEGFERYYPSQLSGGMRQRAALMRTYLYRRDIMLLDEPFGALDAITRERLQDWLSGLISSLNTTVLMVTHDIDEAILIADRVMVMSEKPSRILAEEKIPLPRPRSRKMVMEDDFLAAKRRIYGILRSGGI